MWWSEQHQDSLVVADADGMAYAKSLNYTAQVQYDQGQAFTTNWTEPLLPLLLFYHAGREDHFLAAGAPAQAWATASGYNRVMSVGPQGWVWPWTLAAAASAARSTGDTGGGAMLRDATAPLQHYFFDGGSTSNKTDTMLVGTRATTQTVRADWVANTSSCGYSFHPKSCGYSFERIDSLYPTQRWQQWPVIADADLPPGMPFEHSTLFNRMLLSERVGLYDYTAADTWYPSQASNGDLYSIFTDGEVGFYSRGAELINDPPPLPLNNKTSHVRELTMPSSMFCCSSCPAQHGNVNTGSAILRGDDPFRMEVLAVGCTPGTRTVSVDTYNPSCVWEQYF
jgi:hypothetical protein